MTVFLVASCTALAVLLWQRTVRPAWVPASGEGARAWLPGPIRRRLPGSVERTDPLVVLVPEALDLLALALQGGTSLARAVATVAEVLPGAAGRELAEVAEQLHRGEEQERAWAGAGEHWAPARRTLELAAVAGIPPGPALRNTATDLRRETVSGMEVATARLGVALVVPVGTTFIPAFALTSVVPTLLHQLEGFGWL